MNKYQQKPYWIITRMLQTRREMNSNLTYPINGAASVLKHKVRDNIKHANYEFVLTLGMLIDNCLLYLHCKKIG